jgi:cytochrome P450
MWSTLFTIGILLYITYRLVKYWILDPWRIHKDLWAQGIPGHYTPIVGEILVARRAILAEKPLQRHLELTKKYGSYYHTSFGPMPRLVISDPLLIQGVLKTNARFYHKSNLMRLVLGTLLGYDNLLMAEDNIHSQHRRLIAPVFQHQNINSMISLMVEITSNLLDKWTLAVRDTQNKGIELTLDIHKEMARLTLDIVTGCVFGSGLTKDENVREVIYRNVTTTLEDVLKRILNMIAIIPIINRLPFPSKQRIDKSKRDVKIVIQRIIDDRKKGLTKSACKGLNLLSNLSIDHFVFFLYRTGFT